MTIDERLEALTARHEALAMNLELLSRDGEAQRQRLEKLADTVTALVGVVETLAQVASNHERRLHDLEGGSPQ